MHKTKKMQDFNSGNYINQGYYKIFSPQISINNGY